MRSIALVLLTATAAAAPYDKSGIADWTKVPAVGAEPTFTPPSPKRMRLANGMALLVVENHALPIVSLRLVVPNAGSALDPKAKPGVAAFTADMLDEGAHGLTAIQIANQEDFLGAGITVFAGIDQAGLAANTLTKTLDPTIDLVANIVTQPTFAAADFDRVKGDRATALELRRDRPREVASVMFGAMLYGLDSPYGHPTAGMRESFKSIALADVQQFYKDRWDPKHMTMIVVGDVDPVALQKKLDTTLGRWNHPGKSAGSIATTPAKVAHRLAFVDRPGAQQSDVRIGLVGLDRKDPRYYAFEVLTSTLGGSFTSRLNQRLREGLGITYGINASQDYRVARGPFNISTAIVTTETAHGLTETLKIVDDLATTDMTAEELDKSKEHLIRALPAEFGSNASTAGAFAELVLQGLPDSWYARYSESIHKVSAKDVRAVAKSAIPSGKMVFAVVGDLAKMRADVDKLGLGDAEVRDGYGVPIATTNK